MGQKLLQCMRSKVLSLKISICEDASKFKKKKKQDQSLYFIMKLNADVIRLIRLLTF